MRTAIAVVLVGLVAACAAPGPRMPQDVTPITGTVTFGVRSIEQAQHLQSITITQGPAGRSQSATISTQSIADIRRTAGEFVVHIEVIDAAVKGSGADLEDLRSEIQELPGTQFTYTKDMRTGEERNKIRTASFNVEAVQERAAGLTTMISEGYMGGATVYQNQEVRAGIPNVAARGGDGVAVSRVAGRTTYAGRPAIAFSVAGSAAVAGQDIDVSGIAFIDVETGACVFSEIVASGFKMGGTTGNVTTAQRLTIY